MERTSNRGRPKGSRGGRGKGKRGRKPRVVVSDTEESNELETIPQEQEETNVEPEIDNTTETPAPEVVQDTPMEVKEADELEPQLDVEPPTSFTMQLQRNVPQVMLRLDWDHKVNLIGEKVLNPMIYCCDLCEKPILIYGRMIQCKHVFCLHCARTEFAMQKQCPRCKDKVIRVEQTGLGTVFMCIFGGSRYGKTGCRRTYLSQRDLQAHINHRHMTAPQALDIKTTEKSSSVAVSICGTQQQQNSHLRKDSMVQPPPAMPHPAKHGQPYNPSVFPSARNNDNQQSSMMNPHAAANKMSHHSQEMHGFYNNQGNYGGHSFGNNNSNGAGSSSGMQNNYNNYMGHYSQQAPQQPQQNWNQHQQQQQYFR